MRVFSILVLSLLGCSYLSAATLHIGPGKPYPNLAAAAAVAQPGDTLLLHAATYSGGLFISNLKGTPNQWITIRNAPGATVIFQGGTNAIQFTDPAYVHIAGLIFQQQTGNGLNVDDGGTYATPAHHLIFERCIFRDMAASGNNDLLKLSGVDHFEVLDCLFQNGAAGGSGIDMVGCHFGKIVGNRFENMGSNAIQCKGGSERVRIERNFFKNCGQRSLNIGGSTGLAFFRPDTARFEAARVQVFSNIFIGSQAPVAYVGAVEVDVAHNTLYRPERWAIRILQETVDTNRFLPCGANSFRNNIVVMSNANPTAINIGPNTAPQTFTFSNNLWFHADNPNWAGPNTPVAEPNRILNQNPLLQDPGNEHFTIPPSSPAAGRGLPLSDPKQDFLKRLFANPPSIGAIEANPVSSVEVGNASALGQLSIFPNPAPNGLFRLVFPENTDLDFPLLIVITDLSGRVFVEQKLEAAAAVVNAGHLPKGVYVVRAGPFAGRVALGF
ncbi:MAG: right-handed parallel beta-helix repeat-containing protein [Saprospiraceae bacterium]|nr:right-handed parallel beta-helix repeat-containing protein [Saprospiraceae bacterium]MDW8229258.1 right-handed parallel beta-helix repeat-containing protein [Saprospiraceae bacterium]